MITRKHSLCCLTSDSVNHSHPKQLKVLSERGVNLVQVRAKSESISSFFKDLKTAIEFAHSHDCKVIINDYVEHVNDLNADGVHLGVNDCNPDKARQILGPRKIIGLTVHSWEEAEKAKQSDACNYVGIGPVRRSQTKKQLWPKLSMENFKEIISFLYPIPAFLIGGLSSKDFNLLRLTGAHGICICSAMHSGKIFGTALNLLLEKRNSYNDTLC